MKVCDMTFSYCSMDVLVGVNPVGLAIVGEAGQLAATVVLVMDRASHVLQVLKVRSDHHVAQGNEVAVF